MSKECCFLSLSGNQGITNQIKYLRISQFHCKHFSQKISRFKGFPKNLVLTCGAMRTLQPAVDFA